MGALHGEVPSLMLDRLCTAGRERRQRGGLAAARQADVSWFELARLTCP